MLWILVEFAHIIAYVGGAFLRGVAWLVPIKANHGYW